jgi:hypothetical protein
MGDLLFDLDRSRKKHKRTRLIQVGVVSLLLVVGLTSGIVAASSHQAKPIAPASLKISGSVQQDTPTSSTQPANSSPTSVNTTKIVPAPKIATPSTYTNTAGNQVESPDYNPNGATAMCVDGTFSHSQTRQGTCSDHGGVDHWITATTTPAPAAGCNASQRASDETWHNSAVTQENNRNQQAVAQIQSQYASQFGGMSSGLETQAISNENQQHQQNLTGLQTQLNSELAAIGCS